MSRSMSSRDAYTVMLKEYPDVMNIEQMSKALGISTKTGYRLLHSATILSLRIGRDNGGGSRNRVESGEIHQNLPQTEGISNQLIRNGWIYMKIESKSFLYHSGLEQIDYIPQSFPKGKFNSFQLHHISIQFRIIKNIVDDGKKLFR